MRNFRFYVLILVFVLLWHGSYIPASAASGSEPEAGAIVVSHYIAFWGHDDLGYHPAVAFSFTNETGEPLTSSLRYQARFMDVRNNALSVGRKTINLNMPKDAQAFEVLMGTEDFELTIDSKSWPQVECKVLYKLGEEEESHILLTGNIESFTMSTEEAIQRLRMEGPAVGTVKSKFKRKHKQADASKDSRPAPESQAPPETPLAATALPLSGKPIEPKKEARTPAKITPADKRIESGWHFKNAAGLSDDFFDFEQAYGRPQTYEASPNKWTWAKYQPPGDVEIYAGSRAGSSKADVVVACLKSSRQVPEAQLIGLGKEFIVKYKSQLLGAPVRTVRYLPGGRVQITNLPTSTFHFSIYSTSDSPEDNRYYVVLSRVPASSDATLLEQAKRSKLLRFMLPVMGDPGDQQ